MRSLAGSLTAAALTLAAAACTSSPPGVTAPSSSAASQPACTQPVTSPPVSPGPLPSSSGPRPVHDPGTVTGTLSGPCRWRGTLPDVLPDPRCTPGAYDPAVTAAVLCAPGYTTRPYRPPAAATERFKYDVAYPAYGVARTTPAELDHLVSLELGGANDASNLWPEPPPSPNPKDEAEGDLHAWVCAGGAMAQRRLAEAQAAIAADWTTALAVLGVPA